MTRQKSKQSPVRVYMQTLWDNRFQVSSRSWRKLNHCMSTALEAAVEVGMRFAETDIADISASMRGSYWLYPETLYSHAVENGNTSAAISLEHHLARRPWIWRGKRLVLHDSTPWGEITSIGVDSFIACTYKGNDKATGRTKIEKRTRVTSEIFDEAAREDRRAAKTARDERLARGEMNDPTDDLGDEEDDHG